MKRRFSFFIALLILLLVGCGDKQSLDVDNEVIVSRKETGVRKLQAEYINELSDGSKLIGSPEGLVSLLSHIEYDSKHWKERVSKELSKLKIASKKYKKLDAPEGLGMIPNNYKETIRSVDFIITNLPKSIESKDVSLTNECQRRVVDYMDFLIATMTETVELVENNDINLN